MMHGNHLFVVSKICLVMGRPLVEPNKERKKSSTKRTLCPNLKECKAYCGSLLMQVLSLSLSLSLYLARFTHWLDIHQFLGPSQKEIFASLLQVVVFTRF